MHVNDHNSTRAGEGYLLHGKKGGIIGDAWSSSKSTVHVSSCSRI